jgi:hypothetical protein
MPGHGIVDRDVIDEIKQKSAEKALKGLYDIEDTSEQLDNLYRKWFKEAQDKIRSLEHVNMRLKLRNFVLKARNDQLNHREFDLKQLIKAYTVSEYFKDAVKLELATGNIWNNFALFLRDAEYIQRIKHIKYDQIKVDML